MRPIDADAFRNKRKKAIITTHERYGCEVVEYIEIINAPTLDYKDLVPQGEWIMRGGKRYCSHCGKKAGVTRDSDDFWYTVGTDFCPNCGARVKGAD